MCGKQMQHYSPNNCFLSIINENIPQFVKKITPLIWEVSQILIIKKYLKQMLLFFTFIQTYTTHSSLHGRGC